MDTKFEYLLWEFHLFFSIAYNFWIHTEIFISIKRRRNPQKYLRFILMLLPELTKLNILFFESILIPNIILRITRTKNNYNHIWFWILCEFKIFILPIWSFTFFLYCTMSYSKVVYFIRCISPKHMRQPSRISSCHFLFIIISTASRYEISYADNSKNPRLLYFSSWFIKIF